MSSSSPMVLSYQCADTITANQVVYLDGNGRVLHGESADTAGTKIPVGIAIADQKTTYGSVAVCTQGRAKLLFHDTVTAGCVIFADASGRGIPAPATTITGTSYYVGFLDEANVTATATVAYVRVNVGVFHADK